MTTRQKDKKNLVKVGFFLSALTAILMIMVVSIGKENSIFDKKVDIKARVGNVSALKPGSYVEFKGIRVGTVTQINIISDDEVEITMNVLDKELKWVRNDARVSISTAGLVGDKFVEIYNGSKDAAIFDPQKDILYSEDLTDIKKLMVKGDSIATTTNKILVKLDNILTKIGDGKAIIDMINSLSHSAKNLETVTADLKDAKVGQMVSNVNNTMTNLNKASGSLTRVLTRVETGPGTVNSLIYDDALYDDLRVLLGGAQRNKVIKYYIRESIKNSEKKSSDK